MPVIINQRLAPVSPGAGGPRTARSFMCGKFGTTVSDLAPSVIHSVGDFELIYGVRGTPAANAQFWDWIDHAFKEGVREMVVASYGGSDTYATALALFDPSYGPGQLSVVGETNNNALQVAMANHCNTYGRFAWADTVSGAALSASMTLAAGLPADSTADKIALVGPWNHVQAPTGVIGGSERLVPASALAHGICARVDRDGNPNRAPGGRDYAAQYVDSPEYPTTSSQRDAAAAAHLNLVRIVDGVVQIDSAQTALTQDPSTPFWQVNCARTRMWAAAACALIARGYYMKPWDANGHTAGALKKDLNGVFMDLFSRDALYGVTAQDAFDVNVGSAINTLASAANAYLTVVAQMKLDLYIKTVEVDLVTVPVLGSVIPS